MLDFDSRDDLPHVLAGLGLKGIGAEVGVQRGHFAAHILSKWDGFLFLVDPWAHLPDYDDAANVSDLEHELIYQEALERCCAASPGRRFADLRMTSLEAAEVLRKRFKQGDGLSFVYLDADHSYEHVRNDLMAWWPLVQSGGVMAGHDWVEDGKRAEGSFGVRRATREFFSPLGLQLNVTDPRNDGGWQSWLVLKP